MAFTLAFVTILTANDSYAAGKKKSMTLPDFTKGESIPEGANHDWNLGATGARGWIYSEKMVTTDARQIAITKVAKGSPADGILAVGDVLLGVGGKPFSFDPRTEMGKALTLAESEVGAGNLKLTRRRSGTSEEIVVKLPVMGTYSATAPYDCPKSKRIFEQGCEALAKDMASPSYKPNAIPRSLNALALLASGNPKYLPLVRKEAQWGASFSTDSMQTWYYGYIMMMLSEYEMATHDESIMPGLKRLALEASNGQSNVGSWGHKFAQPDGRLYGYGMMNSPGIPLTISLVMARAAGVKDPAVDRAIERSAKLLRFYTGKGAIPYGDHAPWTQTHEDNGKCGMAAVLFNQLGEAKGAEFFSHMCLASHGAERDGGHTGNYFNILWAMPGVAQSGPQATGAWMKEYGAWYFDLARQWDGTFIHQGQPQMANDSHAGWDSSGAYLLAYAMPLKKIYLTGKGTPTAPQLDAAKAQEFILGGRGWSNKDRNSAYDQLDGDALIGLLGSWSPTIRERAGMALARRKEMPLAPLLKMLESSSLEAGYGACEALGSMKGTAVPAIPALRKALKSDDLWLRIKAAEALSKIGKPALVALPELLDMLAKGATEKDPRAMVQRYLCFSVFGEMLKNSVDGVDRNALRIAVTAGLKNQDGRARGTIGSVYQQLSYEEIKPLLPAIHEAIVTPAPSGEMFAAGIRLQGLALLAKHRIREGLPLCLSVMEIENWGKQDRIKECLRIIAVYGAAAKSLLPQLHQLEKDLTGHKEAKSLEPHIKSLHLLIDQIEKSTEAMPLRSLKD